MVRKTCWTNTSRACAIATCVLAVAGCATVYGTAPTGQLAVADAAFSDATGAGASQYATTDYRNAPLFGMDVMARRKFDNGVSAGLIVGTQQQLGNDSGPTADRLNGFKGRDWVLGPIVTYDRKLPGERSLSLSLRWVPTISSKNRLDSNDTVMATAALIF